MKSLKNPMDEIHAIRYKNYEQTKHLSVTEQIKRVKKQAQQTIEKYRLRVKTLEKTHP